MDEQRPRVLVVDDEPNNLQLMRQILKDDYRLAFANNGTKALEIFEKMKIDIVLLDIMMPEMDGYAVCRELKAGEGTKDVPVIFITAKDDPDDEAKGLELGAIDYIRKPITPSIVKARVKNHLELRLARERIEMQNRELIRAEQLREDMDRITRHDMKSPLNAIIGLSYLLKRSTNLDPKQMNKVVQIETAGYTLLNMINLSLDMFKMERGVYRFEPVKVDIIEIITRIVEEMQQTRAAAKGFSAAVQVNGLPCGKESRFFVKGENLLCYSMLMNLIKNSFEASPKPPAVAIRCDDEGDSAVIRISNKGAVPEEIRDSFFEKYVTAGKKQGTGIGTYSAKLIAQTQAGSLHLDTSDPAGTTVVLWMKRWG